MYKVIILMGESGSGKDFLLHKILKRYPELNEIVHYTTRPIRENEVDGINYHYISIEEFSKMVLDGTMLEATCFNDWFYGTAFGSLDENKINIGVFNPEGAGNLLEHSNIDAQVFYVRARDKTRLLRQLNREEDPDCYEIVRRFGTDKVDFLDIDFPYVNIMNDKEEDAEYCVEIIGKVLGEYK